MITCQQSVINICQSSAICSPVINTIRTSVDHATHACTTTSQENLVTLINGSSCFVLPQRKRFIKSDIRTCIIRNYREGYVYTVVCLSTGAVCSGGLCLTGRAVHILLECILVLRIVPSFSVYIVLSGADPEFSRGVRTWMGELIYSSAKYSWKLNENDENCTEKGARVYYFTMWIRYWEMPTTKALTQNTLLEPQLWEWEDPNDQD